MVLDLLDPQTLGRLVGVVCLMVMAAAAGYAKGFKEGRREGFARGKAIRQHVASINREFYVLPSDVKVVK
jgi:hypothetical protein